MVSKRKPTKKKLKKKSKAQQGPPGGSPKRDILHAPWRYGYIKGTQQPPPDVCVFCDAVRVGVSPESLIVYKGKTASIILNKYPYNNGHTMVIPHRHTADFSSLSKDEFEELHDLLKKAQMALAEIYKPQGMNMGMNLGRAGGAGIAEHIHYHLVPRWVGDSNFMPIIGGTKVVSESLEHTYEKLLNSLKGK